MVLRCFAMWWGLIGSGMIGIGADAGAGSSVVSVDGTAGGAVSVVEVGGLIDGVVIGTVVSGLTAPDTELAITA